jgi:hypothetical protein
MSIKNRQHKQNMNNILHIFIFVFSIGLFIYLLLPEYSTEIGIDKNFVNGNIPSPPNNEIFHVYYFKSYRTNIYECIITEENALKFAKRQFGSGNIRIIEEPIKIVRYNFESDIKQYLYERQNLSIEHETNSSCFHFIRKGYYYTKQNLYWAYDQENSKMYMCCGVFER